MKNCMTFHRRKQVRLALGGAILLILVMATGIVIWHTVLKDRLIPKRWGVVEENVIFRSGRLPPALLKKMLRRHQIRQIVDLTFADPAGTAQKDEKKIAAELGIQYFNFPLYGSGIGEVRHYARALAVMTSAKKEHKPVLVHCAAGTQRTGGVVAAYRVLIEKKPTAVAYAELIQYGWCPEENQILLEFLNSRMAELAGRLLEMQLIDAIPQPLPVIGP